MGREKEQNKHQETRNIVPEASTVFLDENAVIFDDDVHSKTEERFLLLGMSDRANLCIVVHCYRESDEIIRIISARQATKNETKTYNKYLKGWK